MNNINLIGRLTRDPENKIAGNVELARFTLAVDRRFKKDGAPTADFFDCVCFGKLADLVNQYVFKGTKIAITGEAHINPYTAKDGTKRYPLEITVNELTFCESRSSGSGGAPEQEPASEPAQKTDSDGFMAIPDDATEELPFA